MKKKMISNATTEFSHHCIIIYRMKNQFSFWNYKKTNPFNSVVKLLVFLNINFKHCHPHSLNIKWKKGNDN